MAITLVGIFVIDAVDNLVPVTTIPACIFSLEKEEEETAEQQPDGNVAHNYAMS